MKRFLFTSLVCLMGAGVAMASPDIIEMKKNVKFNHGAHKAAVGNCKKCHEKGAGGKIAGFDKAWAHKNCKACHAEMKQGPIACKDCHK